MANAVRFYQTGGPEVLKYESVAVPKPGPGEVHIRHVAVGLNYADTYFRTGYYPAPLPNGIGVEASGTILRRGSRRDGFRARRSRHLHRQPAGRLQHRARHADRLR